MEYYINEARSVLQIRDAQLLETNSMRVAFALITKVKEKEKELIVMEKEKEKDKELSVLRTAMEKDKEKEIALLARTYLERDAYRKSQLMHVTQRYVKVSLNGC